MTKSKKVPAQSIDENRELGSNLTAQGAQFSIYAPKAERAWIALFDEGESTTPAREIALDQKSDCNEGIWQKQVDGVVEGTFYAWRFDGEQHNPKHYLLDPYANAVAYDVDAQFPKGIVTAPSKQEWHRPTRKSETPIIYEMHVRGFTQSDSSGVDSRGRYAGVVEKIDYLKALGVDAVELLPVHACGELILDRDHPESGGSLTNYWGYNPLTFMAPDPRYAGGDGLAAVEEFREMVRAFHSADIAVLVDVVYNHTAEMGVDGPTQSLRGIDAETYYIIDDQGEYVDFTGCGNTVRAGNPITEKLVVDSLRRWHQDLGVDGFRFDLASAINRDADGELKACSKLIKRLAEDPNLASAQLIGEAWDTGGAYQVGGFGTSRWRTWNDRFRDDVRRYWRGDPGLKGEFALRLTGSPDLYADNDRGPHNSVNFVASHDGFTLRDVVSYNEKHNEANGENNRDGHNHDHSWNCGTEGETDSAEINELRGRIQRSMLATVFLSLGVPMIASGDECGRTQQGNNNAYCQDNDISWFDWTLPEKYSDTLAMVQALTRFRKSNSVFQRNSYFTGEPEAKGGAPDIASFDFAGEPLQWESEDDAMACRIDGSVNGGTSIYFMFNPTLLAREFYPPEGNWKLQLDTTVAPFYMDSPRALEAGKPYIVGRKGLVVLVTP